MSHTFLLVIISAFFNSTGWSGVWDRHNISIKFDSALELRKRQIVKGSRLLLRTNIISEGFREKEGHLIYSTMDRTYYVKAKCVTQVKRNFELEILDQPKALPPGQFVRSLTIFSTSYKPKNQNYNYYRFDRRGDTYEDTIGDEFLFEKGELKEMFPHNMVKADSFSLLVWTDPNGLVFLTSSIRSKISKVKFNDWKHESDGREAFQGFIDLNRDGIPEGISTPPHSPGYFKIWDFRNGRPVLLDEI